MLQKIFPFKIQTIQTDNGTEFTYKYISDTELCLFDIALKNAGVQHKLIPPRTPWHNGKVERSHRNDQRYFYNWEKFASVKDLNRKLKDHLHWSNRKPIRTLGGKSPLDLLREILSNAWFFSIPLFFTFCGSYLFTTQKLSRVNHRIFLQAQGEYAMLIMYKFTSWLHSKKDGFIDEIRYRNKLAFFHISIYSYISP